jgi:hypothetical protein
MLLMLYNFMEKIRIHPFVIQINEQQINNHEE